MAFAGWITIGTRNDTSKFDKSMAQLEKKISDRENKKIELTTELKSQEAQLEQARKKVDELAEAYEKVSQAQKVIESGKAGPQEFMDAVSIQQTYGSVEQVNNAFEKAMDIQDKIEGQVEQTKTKYDELEKEVDEYKAKLESIDLQKHQSELTDTKEKFNDVGKSIQGSVKNIGRMIVGIFGIRSAYMAIRQASSTLAQYDQTYAANLKYIRWALAQAIAPVLRYIVNLAATLLNYVIAILQAWFGLFKNVDLSAKAFNKMKAGAGGVAKAAKEINKQLAGFDEMNILQDTSSSGGGGGGGMPSIDFGKDVEVPKWLQWIIDNKDLILAILAGVAAGLTALQLGFTALQSLGIGIAIAGIVYAIEGLMKYINDPSWENFGQIVEGIGFALVGIGIATGNLLLILAGVGVAVSGVLFKQWDEISKKWDDIINKMQNKANDFNKSNQKSASTSYNVVSDVLKNIKSMFEINIQSWRTILDGFIKVFSGDFSGFKDIVLGIFGLLLSTMLEMVMPFISFIKLIIGGLWSFIQEIGEKIKSGFSKLIDYLKAGIEAWKIIIAFDIAFYKELLAIAKNNIIGLWNTFKNKASEAWSSVKNVFSNVGSFFGNIWNTIKSKFTDIGQKVGNAIGGAFRNAINSVLSAAQRVINTPINTINRLISVINAVPGISLGRLSTISLPRLATGAIINMPNRGVNIGGAIAGESGREGILPLTDTRAMQMLGEEIGKWITINANITNTMNGRIISRELQKIQNDERFAYNS